MAQSELEVLTASVDSLTGEISSLRAETVELHDYGRRSRTLIWRQWVIIVVVVLLAAWVWTIASDARQAATTAQRNAVNSYDACLAANKSRATTRDLWSYVIAQPSIQTLSPKEQATRDALVAAFRVKIATSYADQDCSKLAPQPAK